MRLSPHVARSVTTLIVTFLAANPASATTLIRQGLDKLTEANEAVVHGQVLDIHSYWNTDHSMIMTDVHVGVAQVLKGDKAAREITFTLLGGAVGDVTTLVIGGPDLVPGSEYVLFLNRERLHGERAVLTVRDLIQGAFEIADLGAGRRAYSQALAHGLLPDARGLSEPPGGTEGLAVDELLTQIRQLAGDR